MGTRAHVNKLTGDANGDEQRERVPMGTVVRVRWGALARRAKVMGVDGTQIKVIFLDDDSPAVVEMRDIGRCEDFEKERAKCSSLEEGLRCKEEGNILFKKGDPAAAIERYDRALRQLGRLDSTSPTLVMHVVGKSIWTGMVNMASLDSGAIIKYQSCVGGVDFVDGPEVYNLRAPQPQHVKPAELLVVHAGHLGDLQAALRLNRARCWIALGLFQRAVEDCCICCALRRAETGHSRKGLSNFLSVLFVIFALLAYREWYYASACVGVLVAGVFCVGRSMSSLAPDKRLCTALFLRARAHLQQRRIAEANQDAYAAEAIASKEQRQEIADFMQELDNASKNTSEAVEPEAWCLAAEARLGADSFVALEPAAFGAVVQEEEKPADDLM